MIKRTKKLLGLDLGSYSVKAMEFTRVGKDIFLSGYGQTVITSEEERRNMIEDMLVESGIKTRSVVTAVSGRSVIVRYVTMLKMNDADLKNAVTYEADKYIPFEIDEVVLDAQRLEEEDDPSAKEMKVLLVAVKRNLIEEHVALIEDLGLLPNIVDVDSFALGNAFELRNEGLAREAGQEEGDADKVIALIDIGGSKTNINIVRGDASHFTREVYIAGKDFTEAIGQRLSMEKNEVELLKREPGERQGEIMDAINPVLDDLTNEIHLSFDYFENQFDQRVEEVCLSGGGSNLAGLEEILENVFDRPTAKWDPTESLEVEPGSFDLEKMRANAAQLAISVGLASRIRDL